jgi:prolyl-tRNA editing enzyme YbaK/EbsC (Cys-tRNA(Pro) deacylase)
VLKILTPPPGLLEFLERVGSNAKVYEIASSAEQLSLSLGCREEEIITTTLILRANKAPRLSVHSRNQTPELLSSERAANPTQVYLLTGYSAEWMPPFGLPHLLETAIDSRCLESPCLYIPAGVLNGWMVITPEELANLTDFKLWSRVFAA